MRGKQLERASRLFRLLSREMTIAAWLGATADEPHRALLRMSAREGGFGAEADRLLACVRALLDAHAEKSAERASDRPGK